MCAVCVCVCVCVCCMNTVILSIDTCYKVTSVRFQRLGERERGMTALAGLRSG